MTDETLAGDAPVHGVCDASWVLAERASKGRGRTKRGSSASSGEPSILALLDLDQPSGNQRLHEKIPRVILTLHEAITSPTSS